MTQHPKAEAARKAVERMEQERVMVHGIEVKPGQVWAFEGHSGDYPPSRVVSVDHAQRVIRIVDECATPEPDEWGVESFARVHPRLVNPDPGSEAPNDGGPDGAGSCPKPEAPSSDRGARWTDAEWAAEAVALSRRQADAARAEARELRAEFEDRRDRLRSIAQAVIDEIGSDGPQSAQPCVERLLVKYREAVAERDEARADLDHLHTGTIDHERIASLEAELSERRADVEAYKLTVANMMRMLGRSPSTDLRLAELAVGAEVKEVDKLREELAETRAALEAARAAVPSPRGSDAGAKLAAIVDAYMNGRDHEVASALDKLMPLDVKDWSPPVLTPEQVRAHLAEGKAARVEVDKRLAKMERPPEGRDPATRTRALPVVPATCGECDHFRDWECRHPERPWPPSMLAQTVPSPSCPIRAELAKAGGA